MATEETASELVVVRICGDNAEASLIRSLLESRGIDALVQGENHRSMLGAVGAYIELRVMVSAAQRAEAEEVLAELDSGALESGASAEASEGTPAAAAPEGATCAIHQRPATSTCDRCGSFLCDQCDTPEGMICTACETRLEAERRGDPRSTRRRWIAMAMLFVMLGGPVVFVVIYRLVTGR